MRTKTLLLTAALSAAGIASTMAQTTPVYSVNAVGYVNTDFVKGFTLAANPLDNKNAGGNTIQTIFGTATGISPNFTVYTFESGKFGTPASYDEFSNDFQPPAAASKELKPGAGFFAFNPSATTVKVTFVGDVPTGDLKVDLVKGFQIVSSPVPQAGKVQTDLGYVPDEDDTFYQFDAKAQKYSTPKGFSLGSWDPAEPTLDVGEAAFLSKSKAGTWKRTFTIQ